MSIITEHRSDRKPIQNPDNESRCCINDKIIKYPYFSMRDSIYCIEDGVMKKSNEIFTYESSKDDSYFSSADKGLIIANNVVRYWIHGMIMYDVSIIPSSGEDITPNRLQLVIKKILTANAARLIYYAYEEVNIHYHTKSHGFAFDMKKGIIMSYETNQDSIMITIRKIAYSEVTKAIEIISDLYHIIPIPLEACKRHFVLDAKEMSLRLCNSDKYWLFTDVYNPKTLLDMCSDKVKKSNLTLDNLPEDLLNKLKEQQ